MSSLPILQAGEPVLRQKAREVSLEEIHSETFQELIQSMQQAMYQAPGVGLAAAQIGLSLQLIVIEDKLEYMQAFSQEQLRERGRSPVPFHVLINPKLSIIEKEEVEFYEGCLSVAGFVGLVPRALAVEVHGLNENAEPVTLTARGWYARILQHEIDHLHGILCIDRMKMTTFTTIENFRKYWS